MNNYFATKLVLPGEPFPQPEHPKPPEHPTPQPGEPLPKPSEPPYPTPPYDPTQPAPPIPPQPAPTPPENWPSPQAERCPYRKMHPTGEMIFFLALPTLIFLVGWSLTRSRRTNSLSRHSPPTEFRLNFTAFISPFLKRLFDRDDATRRLAELRQPCLSAARFLVEPASFSPGIDAAESYDSN
jgi:hypothetical protein